MSSIRDGLSSYSSPLLTRVAGATKQRYYPSVQGLRGFSALCVLIVHIYLMSMHAGFLPNFPLPLVQGLSTLGNGVALFFIISGFVIPASLVRHRDVGRFLIDRCLRIMPVFVAIHLLVFTIGPFIGYKWLSGVGPLHYAILFATNLTFMALPLGLPLGQQNSWTLTYEWGFYIFVALAWLAVRTGNPQWRALQLKALVPLILATMVLCATHPICLYFLIGIAFSLGSWDVKISPYLEAVVVPFCLIGFFYCAQYVSFVSAIPPALIIFCAVLQENSLTSRFLCTRPLQYIGKISYSLYLIHPLAMFPLQLLGAHLVSRQVPPSLLFLGFVLTGPLFTLVLSIASYELLEVRLRSLLSNLVARRASARLRETSYETKPSLPNAS